MVYSNNVRPNPEIRITIPEFIVIPYTNNKVFIKGDFAVGKYLDGNYLKKLTAGTYQSYVKNPLSHHKSLYLRIGDIRWKKQGFQYTIGVDDYVQWHGKNYVYKYNDVTEEWEVSNPPAASNNFFKVLWPGDEYTTGSHVSSYNLKIDYGLNYAGDVFSFYIQHPIEAKDDIFLKNYRDMFAGLQYKSLRKKLLSGFVLEYLYTKNQRGKQAHNKSNYYNEIAHPQGASYYGRTMGNPILLSPEYNEDGEIGFKADRVFSIHAGMEGYISRLLKYKILYTYGDSNGTYEEPYSKVKNGITSYLELKYDCPKVEGLSIKCSIANEKGDFFVKDKTRNFGVGLSVRKTGKLF